MDNEQVVDNKSSMMGEMKSSPKPTAPDAQVEGAQSGEANWYLMDGVPGVGDKPEYLSPKYKTLAEQARAYNELHKTLVNTQGAPEQYEFGEYQGYVNPEDPAMLKFMNFAKQNRFSQDAFSEIVGTLVEYEKGKQPDINKEIERLGPDGAKKIATVQQWAENTFSQDALDTIGKIAKNADVINLLDEMRQYVHHNASQPPGNNMAENMFTKLTVREVEAEMQQNYKRYQDDPRYRAEIQAKFAQAVGEDQRITVLQHNGGAVGC